MMTMTTTTGRGGDADDVIDGIAKNTTTKITTRSIYNVEWLMRFWNDDLSRAWRMRRTEVQPAHAIRDGRPPMRLSASEEEEKEEVDDVGEEGCGTRGDDGLARVDYRSSDTTINLKPAMETATATTTTKTTTVTVTAIGLWELWLRSPTDGIVPLVISSRCFCEGGGCW
jgi:hypothetical protein